MSPQVGTQVFVVALQTAILMGVCYLIARAEGDRTRKCTGRLFDQLNANASERIEGVRKRIERHECACGGRLKAGRDVWEALAISMDTRLGRLEEQSYKDPFERASLWITETADDDTLNHLLEIRAMRRAAMKRPH